MYALGRDTVLSAVGRIAPAALLEGLHPDAGLSVFTFSHGVAVGEVPFRFFRLTHHEHLAGPVLNNLPGVYTELARQRFPQTAM